MLDARPNDARVLLWLASLHSEFDQSAEAIEAYTRVLQIESGGAAAYEAYTNLGHIYAALGHLPEAVDAFRHALRGDANAEFTRFSLGKVLLTLGEEQGALAEYEALKKLESRHADELHIMV